MTQFTLNACEILIVPVLEDAYDFELYRVNNESIMFKYKSHKHPNNVHDTVRVDYHKSGWNDFSNYRWPEIIGRGDLITEEQWKGIVEEIEFPLVLLWKNYDEPGKWLGTPKKSGLSLIKSKGYEGSKIVILVKK